MEYELMSNPRRRWRVWKCGEGRLYLADASADRGTRPGRPDETEEGPQEIDTLMIRQRGVRPLTESEFEGDSPTGILLWPLPLRCPRTGETSAAVVGTDVLAHVLTTIDRLRIYP